MNISLKKAGLKEAYSSCSMSFHKATLALRWHAHTHPVLPLTLWPLLECRSGPETAPDWVPQAGWCMSTCDQTYSWEGVHREGMYTIIPCQFQWIATSSAMMFTPRLLYSPSPPPPRYKKNIKKAYIVHPTNFIRIMMTLFKPIIRYIWVCLLVNAYLLLTSS